jgi:diacylglycerol kinase family enzyme
MSGIFDSLDYTKGAEAIGIKREHAEYQAQQMAKLIDNSLATKVDLLQLEQRLLIKLGSLMIAGIGILGFILKH